MASIPRDPAPDNSLTLLGEGYAFITNRCPGEWVTIDLMKQAVRLLTTAMKYDVPEQDLQVDLSRMPTAPRSGFVMTNVRAVSAATAVAGCRVSA